MGAPQTTERACPLIVGIAGGSGSGKTVMASMLAEAFAPLGVELLKQDSYYIDRSALPVSEVLDQYTSTVRHMHERYVEPTKQFADLVVNNDGLLQDAVACVSTEIQALLRKRDVAAGSYTANTR